MADLGILPAIVSALAVNKATHAGNSGNSNGPARKPVLTLTRNQQDQTFNALYSLGKAVLILGGVGGAVWGGRKIYLNWKANKESNQGLNEANPSSFAKQIRLAIAGPGTNEEALREVFRKIPSYAFWLKVIQSYNAQYHPRKIINDLEDDLGPTEYVEMMAILNAKKDITAAQKFNFWAERLKAAFDYQWMGIPQTDEEAVYSVFRELPNRQSFVVLAKVFEVKYGEPLIDALQSELDQSEQKKVAQIYQSKTS
ncbi:MAG: hypothetical protein H6581_20645 [Bacteroidia bacterium]|nr:hypothetical protein [Bacteroidia bacterium]